ncbi:MAG: carbamate kinase [Deltaproteobacteria bacterium]|nr:carbamate kinase [Deltaproteobacteria bacterium]
MKPVTIISIGGNAILPKGEKGTIDEQFERTMLAMGKIAKMLEYDSNIVITHGNGPIVGNIVIRNEAARDIIPAMPLYICDADSEGGIGFMLQQSLYNCLKKGGIKRDVVTLVTQVVVAQDDPAFLNPTKPIGPFYSKEDADLFARDRNWILKEDSNRGYRRVVPSPKPKRIIESHIVKKLADDGVIVIAAGGGGVPVIEESDGRLKGIDAVIDKDLATAVLAKEIEATRFINLTSIDRVYINFGKSNQKGLDCISIDDAVRYFNAGEFALGSMGPKIESAIAFLNAGGKEVLITSPESLENAMQGKGGTRITQKSKLKT